MMVSSSHIHVLFNSALTILYDIKVAAGDVSIEGRDRMMKKVHGYVIESEAVHKIK